MMKLDRRSLIVAALGFAPVWALAAPARAGDKREEINEREIDPPVDEVNEREVDLPRKEIEARRRRRRRRRKERKEEVNEREVDRELY